MKKLTLNKLNFPKEKVIKICNLLSLPLQFLGCFVLYFVIESLCRHSAVEAWDYMKLSPLIALYNTYLIFTTTLVVYLFRRRILARIIVGAIWLGLGAVNGFLLLNRVTPFTGPDLKLITDAIKIMNKYLSPTLVVLVLIGLGVLLYGLFLLFRKGLKYQGKIRYWLNIPLVLLSFVLFFGVTDLALEKRVLSSYFGNIAYAYLDYGFPYCLGVTLLDTGIGEPNGYSEELMDSIMESQGKIEHTNLQNLDVNIIFLQLETFIDPTEINFLEFSQDPIPNFRNMMKNYTSGYYKVPSVGAGTANTEFESITGMSLYYFGPGEYPYKSILKKENCESAAFVLKDLGYSTHAIHNNEANFYSRRTVFSRLGFDTFTSEEYMEDITDTTPMGWVKDHILIDEIFNALEYTETPDYIYTISVQGHGDYPEEPLLEDPVIEVTGAESEGRNNAWEYYVNQLYEMDLFIKELTDRLSEYDEPVVLMMYGDHLPTMDLTASDMKNRYLFQTKYVMWDNFGLPKKNKNIAAYQAVAEVFDRLDIHEGTVFNYHQTRTGTKNYQVDLQALQYDILYGDRYVYGGEQPFERTKLQLGTFPVEFHGVELLQDGAYHVTGKNFTGSCRLEVNGELAETSFVNGNTLYVTGVELEDGDEICVAVQSNSSTKKVLSRTEKQSYVAPLVPTPEPTPTVEVTPSVSPTPDATGEVTPSISPTPDATGEVTPSISPTPDATGEVIPSVSPTQEASGEEGTTE